MSELKLKGTAGPWTVTENKVDKEFIINGKTWENFAKVYRIEADDEENGTDFIEAKSNAKLITAAPELLNVLERIFYLSEEKGVDGCAYGDTNYDSNSVVFGHNELLKYLKDIIKPILKKALEE